VSILFRLSAYLTPLTIIRPEQLVLEDDPSFLPEFALPPPELFANLDLDLNLDITRSGESQSLTPFGSQQPYASSHAGSLGGLVLPTSSPQAPGSFRLQGDNDAGSPGDLAPVDDGFDYGDPGFSFDENGELFEAPPAQNVAATPAARSGTAMHSDAAASAKVRKEHEEGRMGGAQVSSTAIFCVVLYLTLTPVSCGAIAKSRSCFQHGGARRLTWGNKDVSVLLAVAPATLFFAFVACSPTYYPVLLHSCIHSSAGKPYYGD
jgi:hypothetical protein